MTKEWFFIWLRSHLDDYRGMVSKDNFHTSIFTKDSQILVSGSQLLFPTALCFDNIHQRFTALGSMKLAKVSRSLVSQLNASKP